jgi:gastrin-releasing peptide receptor
VFSTAALFISLAVADLIASVGGTLSSYVLDKVDLNNLDMDFDCKMRAFATSFGKFVSSLVLMAITIERALAIYFPHKMKILCSPSKIKVSLFMLWTMCFCITMFGSIQSEAVFEDGFIYCNPTPDGSLLMYFTFIHPLLEFSFEFLLPIFAIVIGSVAILLKLYKRVNSKATSRKTELTQIFYTIVIINAVFVLSKLPFFIYNIVTWILVLLKCEDIDPNVVYFWKIICLKMDDINHAVNFFIYFLTGSQFRNDVKNLLFGFTKKCRNVH